MQQPTTAPHPRATPNPHPGGHPRPVVEARDLRMRYGAVEVLRGVDLTVHAGEVLALLGPNGAGKTTTIEVLEGFRRRSGGWVRVLGTDPDDGREDWQARLGVVLQSWRDHARWTVRDLLVHLGRYYRPYSTPERPKPLDADRLLASVGLVEQADRRVGRLSGGQRRRLDVAIGLVGHPELLFLDEPTTGFDPAARRDFHALVRSLATDRSTAIVLTTHDLAEAELLADSVAVLVAGRIVEHGTTDEIARRHAQGTAVSYRLAGTPVRTTTEDVTGFLRRLLDEHGHAVTDLAVRPRSLEDAYLEMIGAPVPGADPWRELTDRG